MAYNKGLYSNNGGSKRGRPFVLILVIIFGAALLGVMVLHKLRERRIYNLVVKDKDLQLLTLQLLLQKERNLTKELRKKNEEMKANIYSLRSQKMELDRNMLELQSTMDSLKDEQKVMESTFEETQNELRITQQKNIGLGGSEILALRENLQQKEAEIKDLKEHLVIRFKTINDSSIIPETVTAEYKTGIETIEKDEHSGDSAKYGGGDKHIINEDASKSTSTIKDGVFTVELNDEIHKNEHPQEDGGASVTEKDFNAEAVEVGEKKGIKEEQPRQLKGNADGGGQHLNVKQLEDNSSAAIVKRKHGHVSRTKAKRWRTIVNNTLMENNNNPKQEEGHVKLLNLKHDENREDAIVNNVNHLVTNNGTTTYPEYEIRQSRDQEVDVVQ